MAITWEDKNRFAEAGSHPAEWRDDDANQVKREVNNLVSIVAGATKIITKKSDFPAPESGVITLESNTTYRISGAIDLGTDRIDTNGGGILLGLSSLNDRLIYSGTDTMITCNGVAFETTDLRYECPNGTFIEFNGNPSTICSIRQVSITCQDFGSINSCLVFTWDSGGLTSSDSGIKFTGTCLNINIEGVGMTGLAAAESYIDLDGSTINVCNISDCTAIVNAGQTWFLLDTATIAIALNLTNNSILTISTGQAISGFDVNDPYADSQGNRGIEDSRRVGSAYVAFGDEVTTTISGGDGDLGNPAPFRGNFTDNDLHGFDHDGNGVLTYQAGQPTNHFSIRAGFNATAASGTNVVYWFYIAVNGVVRDFSRMEVSLDANDPNPVTLFDEIELSAGDAVQIFVENRSNTTNITGSSYNIMIF